MPNSVVFDDGPYFASHGKAPRGRGSWGFADMNSYHDISKVVFFQGTFSDARRQARRFFAAQPGFSGYAVVMP